MWVMRNHACKYRRARMITSGNGPVAPASVGERYHNSLRGNTLKTRGYRVSYIRNGRCCPHSETMRPAVILQNALLGASALLIAGAHFAADSDQNGPVLSAAVDFVGGNEDASAITVADS